MLVAVAYACRMRLTPEAVQGAALALEGVHDVDVHSGESLSASVLGVGHGIADGVLEDDREHGASLIIDEARDALGTATASQTTNGGLGDARHGEQSGGAWPWGRPPRALYLPCHALA